MSRLPFDADDRAGLIAVLTELRLRAWNRDLKDGVQGAIDDLRQAVLPRLTRIEVYTIFAQAATDLASAEQRFNVLAAKAMRNTAEAEATRIVDGMGSGRKIIPPADNSALLAQLAGRATGSAA